MLDPRLLLSGGLARDVRPGHPAVPHARPAAHSTAHPKMHPHRLRVGVEREINTVFQQFVAGFQQQVESYIQSLSEQSTGMVPVTATVAAPYAAGSPVMQVNDAAVFGTPSMAAPVTATALVGTTSIGTFSLIGSSGNQLILNLAKSSSVPLNIGTTLTATVPVSAASSAAAIFPSYVTASTTQMAVQLVQYFNSLPIPLPRKYAMPHQHPQTGALPSYVYDQIASIRPGSLKSVLLAIPLPTTSGPDLQIYQSAVTAAVATAHLNVLAGVEQIFAGKLQVPPSNASSGTSSTATTSTTTGATSPTG